MRVILGIGNPGAEYQDTRHNCGFLVLDQLAQRHRLDGWSKRWSSLVASWPQAPGAGPAVLVKPQTFVNVSGEALQAVMAFYKLPLSEVLVVVDDLNLPLGTLRVRANGSAGGHNGLRDIEARLGPGYPRLRLGIGRPMAGDATQIAHVLGRFQAEEHDSLRVMIKRAAECVEAWCAGGMEATSRFNGATTVRPAVVRPAPAKPGGADVPPPAAGPEPPAGLT